MWQKRYLKTIVLKKMGQYVSSTFTLYGREKETDVWVHLEEYNVGNPLSRFKYNMYEFILNKKFTNLKAIYLYCGYSRVCKAYRESFADTPYLYIDFYDEETALKFDECKEQLNNVLVDITWLQPEFSKHWCLMQSEQPNVRRYQNYRVEMKK